MMYQSLLDSCLKTWDTISLVETKSVSLQKRIDCKYLLNLKDLPSLLKLLEANYCVVQINDEKLSPYYTVYFDTEDFHYYHVHHRGKLNRFKFRTRKYMLGGEVFNEVKFKTNKGKTKKNRLERDNLKHCLDEKFRNFIEERYPNKINYTEALEPKLHVMYERITLVNKEFTERMTIDINLHASHTKNKHQFENLVIVELKRGRQNSYSEGERALRELRVKKSGFSKYCMGVALTYQTVKKNNFKETIRRVQKLCGGEVV